MSKSDDVNALLGDTPTKKTAAAKKAAPAKKTAAAKEAPVAAKKTAAPAKKAAPAKEAPVAAKRVKEPVVFEEGEREALIKRVKVLVKKPINSKDLAAKMEIATRKLRRVLYSAQSQGVISLEAGESSSAGMTVSPAAA